MSTKRSGWKMERASVHLKGSARPKSNKYCSNDQDVRPEPHTRSRFWVGAYTRADGRRVEGHYRKVSAKPSRAGK
jgi:hypothetical protein